MLMIEFWAKVAAGPRCGAPANPSSTKSSADRDCFTKAAFRMTHLTFPCRATLHTAMSSPQPTHVQVLLATYNGERFLREQIDSILDQTYRDVSILARDDGSSDSTPAILSDYSSRFPGQFSVLPTDAASGSPRANFARLISASGAPYLAFADQDDVWLTDKLEWSMAAMRRMEQQYSLEVPLLVFSDLTVVDQALNQLQPSFWAQQNIKPDNVRYFPRLLTQNVATGCTMLFNQSLARLASPMPPGVFMHDWWVALLAAGFGHACAIPAQTVLYRQHDRNVIGAVGHARVTGIPRWRYHEKRREQWEMIAHQAEALLALYGDILPGQHRSTLEAVVRCERHPSRWVRARNYVQHGFRFDRLRASLAILWYLWDMEHAKSSNSTD